MCLHINRGLPRCAIGKEPTCQCRRPKRHGCDPWVGKIPWRRERLPTPVLWPGEFHGLYSPWGCKESDMTERLLLHFFKMIMKYIAYFFKIFNWSMIALQCSVRFCCTEKWITYLCTNIFSLLHLPLIPHLTPLGHYRAPCCKNFYEYI